MDSASGLILSKAVQNRISRYLATSAGALFLAAGAFKLFMAAPGTDALFGSRAFGAFLEQLNVPFPAFFGLAIPLLEIMGGAGLVACRGVRCWALLLAFDMAAAIFLVGAPGTGGRVGQVSISGEAWRLPLEVTLLLAMLWLSVFPPQALLEAASTENSV